MSLGVVAEVTREKSLVNQSPARTSTLSGALTLFPSDQIPPNPLWETGAVAISLAENGTFADPYLIPTGGPTAHMPPLWVGAMSLVYRVLGTDYLGGLAGSLTLTYPSEVEPVVALTLAVILVA